MYVCPDCKDLLTEFYCGSCHQQFGTRLGIPDLLSRDKRFKSVGEIGSTYDDIYANRDQVWRDQGRTPEFIEYFSGLAATYSGGRLLEVGCGEGFLFAALNASSKSAVDISPVALQRASERVDARFGVALAERLPFADESFDIVVSVGVMEHFLDDAQATSEVRRVLTQGGVYIALIHVGLSLQEKVQQKLREYIFPAFRPLALLQYFKKKVYKPIHQPIQRKYTVATGRTCLERSTLSVERVISLATEPTVPLVGPHVVIYVARK